MTVAILGAGGHGQDIAAIAEACGLHPRLYDDDPNVLTGPDRTAIKSTEPVIIGVNNPSARAHIYRTLLQSDWARVSCWSAAVVHPSATMAKGAAASIGVVVGAGANIGPDTWLQQHSHIGAGSFITRTQVGEFVTIGPMVAIGGGVLIREGAFIGIHATIKDQVTIGAWSVIGAGAVVIDDVPDGAVVAGVPARPLVKP